MYRERVVTIDSRWILGLALGATLLGSAPAHAHFVLMAPGAAFEQGPLGDPQKAPPCGDDGSGVVTNVVTPFQAGETITITIDETVYHPGHYRVALAVNDPSELPPEPLVTPGDTDCGSAEIMAVPAFPVLADGVLEHNAMFGEPQSFDVTLPDDVTCTNCTLQIIQFMSQHGLNNPGGCFYHHCAVISIEGGAADASTDDTADDAGSSGDDGSTSATTATTATTAEDSESDGGNDASATGASATGNTSVTTAGTTDTDTDTAGAGDEDDGGCSCTTEPIRDPLAGLALLVTFAAVRRRRARH